MDTMNPRPHGTPRPNRIADPCPPAARVVTGLRIALGLPPVEPQDGESHEPIPDGLARVMLAVLDLVDRSRGEYGPCRRVASPTNHAVVERRDVVPADVATLLRAMLGLPAHEPAPGELAADLRRPLPRKVRSLDAGAWIAWCLAGLPLFAGEFPSLRRVRVDAGRVAMARAMLAEDGNISGAARLLRSSRKVLRDNLRLVDLHPWRRGPDDEHGPDHHAGREHGSDHDAA